MSDFKAEQYELPKEQFIEFTPDDKGQIHETNLAEKEADAPDVLTAPKMDILRYAARKVHQIELFDPDKSCKKCYGRGYIGLDTMTQLPIGCKCIMPNDPTNQRRVAKQALKIATQLLKEKAERGEVPASDVTEVKEEPKA